MAVESGDTCLAEGGCREGKSTLSSLLVYWW